MSEQTATLKVGAKADLADLLALSQALRSATSDFDAFGASAGNAGFGTASGSGGAGQGGAITGAPPPPPAPPTRGSQARQNLPGGASAGAAPPAPAPAAPGGGAAPASPGGGGSAGSGGAPARPNHAMAAAVGAAAGGASSGYASGGATGALAGASNAIGGAGGGVIGGMIGGALGSVVPGVGTAIGAAAGSALGGAIGGSAGSVSSGVVGWAKDRAYTDMMRPVNIATSPLRAAGGMISGVASGAASMAGSAISMGGKVAGAGLDFASGFGNTTQYGTSSMMDVPMKALQTYLQLSKVITEVNARFKEAGGSAAWFGSQLGYTKEKAAAMAKALGSTTGGAIDGAKGRDYAGFARATGMGANPELAIGTFGHLDTLTGGQMSSKNMGGLLGTLKAVGLGNGRIEEGMAQMGGAADHIAASTGNVSVASIQRRMQLPSAIYGNNQGALQAQGASMMNGLDALLSNKVSQNIIMRDAGFGRRDAAGNTTIYGQAQGKGRAWIEMQKQLESGIDDPRNLSSLMHNINQFGSDESKAMKLKELSGGQLKMHQIDALLRVTNTDEKMKNFEAVASATTDKERKAAGMKLVAGLSKEDRAAIEGTAGFGDIGKGKISLGESRDQKMEGKMLEIGGKVADFLPKIDQFYDNISAAIGEGGGDGMWGLAHKIADAGVDLSALMKNEAPAIRDLLSAILNMLGGLAELAVGMNPLGVNNVTAHNMLKAGPNGTQTTYAGSAGGQLVQEGVDDMMRALAQGQGAAKKISTGGSAK